MKKAALFLILLGCIAGLSFGREGNIGVGIILGEPTGLSLKWWRGRTMALDAGAAWSFANGDYLQVHGDILFHNFDVFNVERDKMALYYGFGGRVKFEDKTVVSLRLPVGISYEIAKTSIELFLEIVPMLDVVPDTKFGVAGGAGFRYFF
jgi:hypothetical protein